MTEDAEWSGQYFNYFTEIEEHFQRARGTGLFLLSPLDWALIESWKIAEIPVEAVLRGIDEAFEKWRSRKSKRRSINSLAYCTQAVMEAAERTPARGVQKTASPAPFAPTEIQNHFLMAASALKARPETALQEIGLSLEQLAHGPPDELGNLESLERRLTAMEYKIVATLRSHQSETELYAIRNALDTELRPYRGKMTAEQLSMLERRYLDTALLEGAKVPRLSLFYLH